MVAIPRVIPELSYLKDLSRRAEGALHEPAISLEEGIAYLREIAPTWLERMRTSVVDFPSFPYDIRVAADDIGFQARVDRDGAGFFLLLNPHRAGELSRSRYGFFCLHEICGHMVHLAAAPFYEPNMETYDAFWVEGLAQALSMVVCDRHANAEPDFARAMAANNLTLSVIHRNIFAILDRGTAISDAARDHAMWLGGDEAEHQAFYARVPSSPRAVAAGQNYYASLVTFAPLMAKPPTVQRSFFERAFQNVWTPEEIAAALL
jgi:hypothetical protein